MSSASDLPTMRQKTSVYILLVDMYLLGSSVWTIRNLCIRPYLTHYAHALLHTKKTKLATKGGGGGLSVYNESLCISIVYQSSVPISHTLYCPYRPH